MVFPALVITGQIIVAIGLCVILTDLVFLRTRFIPFTTAKICSTRELPITLVLYLIAFPWFALTVVEKEAWIEASRMHLLEAAIAFVLTHAALVALRRRIIQSLEPVDESIFLGLGMREQ